VSKESSDLERLPPSRRTLLKAVAAGGAFAVPLIASFSMDAPAMASERTPPSCTNSSEWCTNQTETPPPCSNLSEWCSNQTEHHHHHHHHKRHHHKRRRHHPWWWFWS
jgi:hypothetical protein